MLQTCSRCRSRRIKCDSRLPACANCAKNDLECTFRDDALQEDIPRSYIQSLNERIENLTSQLALHQSSRGPPQENEPALTSSSAEPSQPIHILIPARPGSDLHLDTSVPSRFTRVVFEALPENDAAASLESIFPEHDILMPSISFADRSQLTPSIVRFLLGRYDRCIRPRYDVLVPELLGHDGASFKKLPEPQRFKILMACAIAATREGYKSPNWKPLGQICRDWANELVTPIISAGDGDTLAAILLLIIYELADPSRGTIWELLDLAARTCLQLGWHQGALAAHIGQGVGENGIITIGVARTCGSDEIRLISVLKDIEGSLHTIFNRPTMLSGCRLPATSEDEPLYDLYSQVADQLYGKGRVYENQGCPFVGEIAELMSLLEGLDTRHPVAKETWLSFLPVCFKHKQCIFCFQEADESEPKGMRALRMRVIATASDLISSVHQVSTNQDGFIPPVIASSRTLISGCSLATGIVKRWTPAPGHAKDLIKCTEVLTLFAPHWKGGHSYLAVWRSIIDLLNLEQTSKNP
ncbi:hypothetical protein GQ53DRAFT_797239 [Thozetella sp. PMI_491]|nr:hypothetical protein GQ53DRAFT_797239 [Thozetella sp. PMI_491]